MCGIVDTNVIREVFGSDPPRPDHSHAGAEFFDWVDSGKGRLVSGGRHNDELTKSSRAYRKWARVARVTGRLLILDAETVE